MVFCVCSLAVAETNWNLQAVNENGSGIHSSLQGTDKISVEGIILNRSEYMLDGTPSYSEGPVGYVGGQWQIYIQGDGNDHGGTAIWMGQNYANLPWAGGVGRYTNEQWLDELDRLNYDQRTGRRFLPGDKVRITGLTKFYGGKTNINERHNIDPNNDLTIELVEPGAGLPEPEIITLDMVKDDNDNFIFDPTRQSGCEYYQARLVRLNNVSFDVNSDPWAPNAKMKITDGVKTFPLLLGIGPGITAGSNNLPSQFDVIGILDQEDGSSPHTDGYRIWVTNYDGNGQILADGCDLYGVFALGDINKDCKVDFDDFAALAADWLKCSNPLLAECQ